MSDKKKALSPEATNVISQMLDVKNYLDSAFPTESVNVSPAPAPATREEIEERVTQLGYTQTDGCNCPVVSSDDVLLWIDRFTITLNSTVFETYVQCPDYDKKDPSTINMTWSAEDILMWLTTFHRTKKHKRLVTALPDGKVAVYLKMCVYYDMTEQFEWAKSYLLDECKPLLNLDAIPTILNHSDLKDLHPTMYRWLEKYHVPSDIMDRIDRRDLIHALVSVKSKNRKILNLIHSFIPVMKAHFTIHRAELFMADALDTFSQMVEEVDRSAHVIQQNAQPTDSKSPSHTPLPLPVALDNDNNDGKTDNSDSDDSDNDDQVTGLFHPARQIVPTRQAVRWLGRASRRPRE